MEAFSLKSVNLVVGRNKQTIRQNVQATMTPLSRIPLRLLQGWIPMMLLKLLLCMKYVQMHIIVSAITTEQSRIFKRRYGSIRTMR